MAVKIVIDAGHGGYDNGATYENRREKDDNLSLALAVGEILAAQGYDVVYTRTDDVYNSPVEKARIANQSDADFFVSIHRNSSPNDNQYNGVQTLIFDDSGIKKSMAENINSELEKVGYKNINVDIRPNLAVLRRTKMPAVLVEAGFINSDVDNQLFDDKFTETAMAIAMGIDMTLQDAGMAAELSDPVGETCEEIPPEDATYIESGADEEVEGYQILTGIFRNLPAATYQMNGLINDGFYAITYEDEGLYQVRVGDYNDIEEALIAQRELRDRGYETLIVRAVKKIENNKHFKLDNNFYI